MNFKFVNLFKISRVKAIWLTVLVCCSIVWFLALVYFSEPFVVDSFWYEHEYYEAIKPEDRGLVIQNVTGYINGSVFLTVKNEGNYSVVIKDVILKDQWGEIVDVKNSTNKEILPHTSDIVFSVWFSERLVGYNSIEVFTQRGSYIGGVLMNTCFLVRKIE